MKKNRQLKAGWVAKQFLDVFKARPHWPAKEIQDTIRKAFKVVVKKAFAYRVKYVAHRMLHGSMHDHYNKIGRYLEALRISSPGTALYLVTDNSKENHPPMFQRLFTCFEGLKKGWMEGCRKVICVDACFLKTFLGGQLLSAVGRDGNEQMFPIAWAVVEGENNNSWGWFFTHLERCLELHDGDGIAILSDEHPAIVNAVASVLPKAEHRLCARHIYAHWHKTYKGDEFKLLFWKIAKAHNMADYQQALDELSALKEDAAEAFKSHNPEKFCRAFFDTRMKTNAITNNMAETFNGYIINARTKHLLYMLEDIRAALMQRMFMKRREMNKSSSLLCPRIQALLEEEKSKAADCEEVAADGEAEEYVHECYRKEVYLKAYGGSIPPCEGELHWPRVACHIDPPPIKIGPGRPRKNRRKDPFEDPKKPGTLTRVGMEMTCRICQVKGHNKRTCPKKDTAIAPEPAPKRPRGRPRNDGQPPKSKKEITTPTSNIASTSTSIPTSNVHHDATAQPSQVGRNGRMIRGGIGSRGGGCNRGRGRESSSGGRSGSTAGRGRGSIRGRGRGRNQVPIGVGVIFDGDGTAMTNELESH
ncbi:Transposase for insertion sequence element IS1081 [Bienertia sinuspersici]